MSNLGEYTMFRADAGQPGSPSAEWRRLIHLCNRKASIFGQPTIPRDGLEVYPHVTIEHKRDEEGEPYIMFSATTPVGAEVLSQAIGDLWAEQGKCRNCGDSGYIDDPTPSAGIFYTGSMYCDCEAGRDVLNVDLVTNEVLAEG